MHLLQPAVRARGGGAHLFGRGALAVPLRAHLCAQPLLRYRHGDQGKAQDRQTLAPERAHRKGDAKRRSYGDPRKRHRAGRHRPARARQSDPCRLHRGAGLRRSQRIPPHGRVRSRQKGGGRPALCGEFRDGGQLPRAGRQGGQEHLPQLPLRKGEKVQKNRNRN